MTTPSKPFRPLSRGARQIPRRQYNWMGTVCEKMSGFTATEGYESDRSRLPRVPLTADPRFVEITDSLTGTADVLYKRPGYYDYWLKGAWAPITVGTYGWTEFGWPRGERMWVQYHQQTRQWLPQSVGLIRVELLSTLYKGGGAWATLVEWTTSGYLANPQILFLIYDAIATFQGTGLVGTYPSPGERGYARWAGDRQVWEWVQLACYT